MLELIRVAAGLQDFCEARDWRFCFIVGLTLQRWGEPRETIDVDVTLLTGFGSEEPFIAALSVGTRAGSTTRPVSHARTGCCWSARSPASVSTSRSAGCLSRSP